MILLYLWSNLEVVQPWESVRARELHSDTDNALRSGVKP